MNTIRQEETTALPTLLLELTPVSSRNSLATYSILMVLVYWKLYATMAQLSILCKGSRELGSDQ